MRKPRRHSDIDHTPVYYFSPPMLPEFMLGASHLFKPAMRPPRDASTFFLWRSLASKPPRAIG